MPARSSRSLDTKYGASPGTISRYAWRIRFIPWTRAQVLAGGLDQAQVGGQPDEQVESQQDEVKVGTALPVRSAWATKAMATIDADSAVRNIPARVNASL